MGKIVVARPADGITLNSELEFLLDDNGEIMIFDNVEQARSFLIANGIDTEELRHMTITEICNL